MLTSRKLVAPAAWTGLALIASGCTYLPEVSLGKTFTAERFLATEIPGGSFNQELARAYQARAAHNANVWVNWLDATAYQTRAEAALAGNPLPLYVPADFGVNGEATALRERVIAAVGANSASNARACAEAMALYDQYVEYLYQAPATDAADARAQLDAALASCEGAAPVADNTVYFGFDRADLTAAAMSLVDEVARAIGDSGKAVSVVGHADTVGSLEYNQGLSERRARAVANRLVQLGVPAGTITTAGRSWLEPAVDTGPGVREPRNRRVEIAVSE